MIFDILYTRLFVQYGKTLLNYFGVTIYLKQNYKKKNTLGKIEKLNFEIIGWFLIFEGYLFNMVTFVNSFGN